MPKQASSGNCCWKKKFIYLSPFILGCIAQIVHASETNHQQEVLATTINKGKDREGQQLYRNAVKQLELIDKRLNTDTAKSNKEPTSFTDRLIAKLSTLWSSSAIPALDVDEKLGILKINEYSAATALLEESSRDFKNNDALLLLAELNFFSKYGHPRNYNHAFNYYQQLANTGNATAQQMLGFMYSTGFGNAVKRDQAKALLYHTFAAYGGDATAEMTMGYRYLLGIGTDEKCEDALFHYKNVATKVIDYYLSGPPGGHTPPLSKVRLSEETGGVYGYGASVTTEKRSRNGGSEKSISIDEILQYWEYLAAKQDIDAQLMLGQVYYLGTRSVPRNFEKALHFFEIIVEKIPNNGKVSAKNTKPIGQAAGYLGLMYWRGEGVKADAKIAYQWFDIGVKFNDATSQNALGMMYLSGTIVPKNREKAVEFFKKSAEQDNPHAQVNLAIEYSQSETTMPLAIRYFTRAADAKHLLAFWYLAIMNERSIVPRPSCRIAVSYYKAIAEKGDWLNPTVEDAYSAYTKKDTEGALLNYMLAAERGYEIAQSNVAYMLDDDKKMLVKLPFIGDSEEEEEKLVIDGLDEKELAFIYWSRSATQNNVDARVKLGDYHYKGIGTPVDYERAVSCYRVAAEMQSSPLAFWNLGWMYENGIGVKKDFHLAKRSYDLALSNDQNAYLPVKLSLIKMYAKYYWEWLNGHEVGPALPADGNSEVNNKRKRKEVEQDKNDWDDIGEEMKHKYKIMKQKEREENEGEEVSDDPYALGDLSEEDELITSLLILGLCMLIGYLLYVRQFQFGGGGGGGNNNNNNNINGAPQPNIQ